MNMLDYSSAYYAAGYTPDLIVSTSYVEKLIGDDALTEMLKIEYKKILRQQDGAGNPESFEKV